MKPRISVLTLGVENIDKAVKFYRDGLGFVTEGIIGAELDQGAVAFFQLNGGLRLALWPRDSISHDSGLARGAISATEFTLGHNVNSREEVDKVMAEVKGAGATIVKPAQETFWGGYAGYFQDPDQHLWEVVWNPDMLPEN